MRIAPALDLQKRCPAPTEQYALLINPFYPKDPVSSFGKHVLTPTLALTSFAGATPAHWDIRYWDENLLQGCPPSEPFPQVVALTVHLTFAERAYQLANWYRSRGAIIVMGGLHVHSCPDEVRPHCDIMVKGEGAACWPEILGDIERGEYKPFYEARFGRSYHLDPAPRREILDREAYLTTSSMIATRGCHNRCGFCYLATRGLKMPYSCRHPEQIAAEIQAEGNGFVVFTDNNLGADQEYLRRLCTALKPLEIMWNAAVTLDVSDDPTLIRDMALSGCTGVFIGLESLNDRNIQDARKKSPKAKDYARRVKIFHDYGINVNGSFVFGFDHDHPDVFDFTIDWVEKNKLACSTFHILTPYPGTPLFRQMEAEGRILHKDWNKYDTAHVVFQPSKMSPEELFEGYQKTYQKLFSLPSIWRRRPEKVTSVPAYLAAALLYKRSNLLWHFLIKHRLTRRVWAPLVEISRKRNLAFRKQLEAEIALEKVHHPVDWVMPGV